jgi:hypothetical protein
VCVCVRVRHHHDDQYLVFSYSLISMLGSLLFLGTAPLGVLRLASYTTKLARNGACRLHPSFSPPTIISPPHVAGWPPSLFR